MSSNEIGKVYLIGAGPGAPELITVRGKRLLQECDAVVYDNLIPIELVVCLSDSVEKLYVGKKAGRHSLPQGEINSLLVKLAKEGKNVARLKGADPLTFGRGGEEAGYLRENGVEFEIVPGVTAAVGAAAYSGIPCTDRTCASFVVQATGHKASDTSIPMVPWKQLAQTKGGTLVIYMGVSKIRSIVTDLIAGGMDADTPAAVIERATMPTQRRFITTLDQLSETVSKEDIRSPALFVIGKVVELNKSVEWFGQGPLHGHRIMVLRPVNQASELYGMLHDIGAEVLPCPTIAIEEYLDSAAWSSFKNLGSDDLWLVFTSGNGVECFMSQFITQVGDIRRLAPFRIAAVGSGTAKVLASFNLEADFIPSVATTMELASQLTEAYDLRGAQVVRVQGNLSDSSVVETLNEHGAEVLPLMVYKVFHPDWPEGLREKLLEYPPDTIIFTSGSTAGGFFQLLTRDEVKKITASANVVSIGPVTSKVIESLGLSVTVEAKVHSVSGIVAELLKYHGGRTSKESE